MDGDYLDGRGISSTQVWRRLRGRQVVGPPVVGGSTLVCWKSFRSNKTMGMVLADLRLSGGVEEESLTMEACPDALKVRCSTGASDGVFLPDLDVPSSAILMPQMLGRLISKGDPKALHVECSEVDLRWPAVFVFGVTKAGTTSVQNYLGESPGVAVGGRMSGLTEFHLFDQLVWRKQLWPECAVSALGTCPDGAPEAHMVAGFMASSGFLPTLPPSDIFVLSTPSSAWRLPYLCMREGMTTLANHATAEEAAAALDRSNARSSRCQRRLPFLPTDYVPYQWAERNPDATNVMVVRDPVARASSHFLFPAFRRGPCWDEGRSPCTVLAERPTEGHLSECSACFDDTITRQIAEFNECLADGGSEAVCAMAPFHSWAPEQRVVTVGLYAIFLAEWRRHFAPAQFCFVDVASAHPTMSVQDRVDELRRCIGVPAHLAETPIQVDAANSLEIRDAAAASWLRRVMTNETAAKLRDFYQPYTCRFCQDIGEEACAVLGFAQDVVCPASS